LSEFGHDAGALVVAEGVETLNDALALRDAGVDCGQGWLFGRPGPVEQLAEHYAVQGLNEADDNDDSSRRARL
jgi:EAL domain-containing protein (putative c-di-GMP-specific phosphodiesterase class I)